MDFSKVIQGFRALDTEGVQHVLLGGVAVNLHGLGRTTTVRYVPPDESFVVDLLGRLGDAFRFEDLESTEMDICVKRGDVYLTRPRVSP